MRIFSSAHGKHQGVTVWSDELARTLAVMADDAHAGKVLVTEHLDSVVVAISNHKVFLSFVEANTAYSSELAWR